MRSSIITAAAALLLASQSDRLRAQGQQGSGSPYSAYGFGELAGPTQVSQALMGGVGVALADPFSVSRINPASYCSLLHTSFEAGGVWRNAHYDTETVSSKGQRSDLLGLTIGVPFGKGKWGMALGVNPVSDVGYEISDRAPVTEGNVRYIYRGDGGLNRAFVGFGRMLWQSNDTLNRGSKLSFGVNLDYLFGSVIESRKAIYPPSGGYYNSTVLSELVIRSPAASTGLQFTGDLVSLQRAKARLAEKKELLTARDKKEEMDWLNAGKDPKERKPLKMPRRETEALRFRIGLSAEIPTDLSATNSQLVSSFVYTASGIEYVFDTARTVNGAEGTVHVPLLLGLGLAVQNSHWTLAAEYRRRDWTQMRIDVEGFDNRSTLSTNASYALGASFRPAGDMGGSFFERSIYRAGFRYSDDYLVVGGTQLNQMGASFGLSIPLMNASTRSRLSVGCELGERGTMDNGLIRERYADIYLGITITPDIREQWFRKRRIE